MAKGDKVTGVPYKIREDGVQLIRFAQSVVPQFKIRQDQTGTLYDEAIDVENALYTYTETDIPVEAELIEPEEGVANNDE